MKRILTNMLSDVAEFIGLSIYQRPIHPPRKPHVQYIGHGQWQAFYTDAQDAGRRSFYASSLAEACDTLRHGIERGYINSSLNPVYREDMI